MIDTLSNYDTAVLLARRQPVDAGLTIRYAASMKIWTLSDLHIRIAAARAYSSPLPGIPDADICVLARDIADGMDIGIEWKGEVIARHMPVVFVLGNHDLFGEDMENAVRRARRAASYYPGFHVLDDSSMVIVACGSSEARSGPTSNSSPTAELPITAAECMRLAKYEMPDFAEIYASGAKDGRMGRLITLRDTVGYHKATRAYLDGELARHFDGPTVVVTHHAPSSKSIQSKFEREPSSAAFASDLTALIEAGRPELRVHGHVHHSLCYSVGETKVVCNPRGYGTSTNPDFDPGLVLTV